MKSRACMLFIVLLVTCEFSCQGTQDKSKMQDIEAEVRAVEEKIRDAILSSDLEILDRLWADDYIHTSRSGKIRTKEDRMIELKKGHIKYISIENTDVMIRAYENTAIVTGHKVTEVSRNGIPHKPPPARFTRVWIRNDAGWQLVAMHSSSIAD